MNHRPLTINHQKMNLTSPSQVRALLMEIGVRPSKSLGQNFLVDRNVLNILLETANLSHDDKVLEVGPGLGVVTEQLAGRIQRVVGVEKDKRLFDFLKKRFIPSPFPLPRGERISVEGGSASGGSCLRQTRRGGKVRGKEESTVELICADVLNIDVNNLLRSGLNKVVSNLPYSTGSRILVNLVRAEAAPRQIVVTVQQEVAHRLAARPGSRDYGLLSVWSQLVYQVDMVKTVSQGCFWPKPEVRSAIMNMTRHNRFVLSPEDKHFFYQLTKHAFMHRRKQLAAILSRAPGHLNVPLERARNMLDELGINTKARPENLTVKQWLDVTFRLTRILRTAQNVPKVLTL